MRGGSRTDRMRVAARINLLLLLALGEYRVPPVMRPSGPGGRGGDCGSCRNVTEKQFYLLQFVSAGLLFCFVSFFLFVFFYSG